MSLAQRCLTYFSHHDNNHDYAEYYDLLQSISAVVSYDVTITAGSEGITFLGDAQAFETIITSIAYIARTEQKDTALCAIEQLLNH